MFYRVTFTEEIYVEADSEEEAELLWAAFMSGKPHVGTQELWSKPDTNGVRDLIDKRIISEDKDGKVLYNRQQLVPEDTKEQAKIEVFMLLNNF